MTTTELQELYSAAEKVADARTIANESLHSLAIASSIQGYWEDEDGCRPYIGHEPETFRSRELVARDKEVGWIAVFPAGWGGRYTPAVTPYLLVGPSGELAWPWCRMA